MVTERAEGLETPLQLQLESCRMRSKGACETRIYIFTMKLLDSKERMTMNLSAQPHVFPQVKAAGHHESVCNCQVTYLPIAGSSVLAPKSTVAYSWVT